MSIATSHGLAENVVESLWFGDDDPHRTEEEASSSLAAAVGTAIGLKPFPASAARAMEQLSDPDVDVDDVVQTLESDPALATHLLRAANAATFAAAMPLDGIRAAVMRLGLRRVQTLVAGIATMGLFRDVRGVGCYFRDHCAAVAGVARALGEAWGQTAADDVFLAALLHDIGKLLSLQVGEVDYPRMGRSILAAPNEVHIHERRQVGYDHAVLAGHVLAHWNLPERVVHAVGLHHQPGRASERDPQLGLMVALVRLADRLDYQLQRTLECDEAFIERLAITPDASYATLGAPELVALWPHLVQARAEVAALLV